MFTDEQLKKAAECKSVDELLALAKEEKIQLSQKDAEKIFAQLSDGEIKLEDLDKISGSGCWDLCGIDQCTFT